ncbi:hypothetical protein ADUPG1_001000 [Aduncisulcus paluster]|uniref:Uncharacterized protein n=1 Tax=Aduncisulcus paluster TaxID=2918883 RepID=A0ABQ5K8Z3_9EUKA|nr:hypothetical protein ADUPG1_001000 [Aduncisulcus paluster]
MEDYRTLFTELLSVDALPLDYKRYVKSSELSTYEKDEQTPSIKRKFCPFCGISWIDGKYCRVRHRKIARKYIKVDSHKVRKVCIYSCLKCTNHVSFPLFISQVKIKPLKKMSTSDSEKVRNSQDKKGSKHSKSLTEKGKRKGSYQKDTRIKKANTKGMSSDQDILAKNKKQKMKSLAKIKKRQQGKPRDKKPPSKQKGKSAEPGLFDFLSNL